MAKKITGDTKSDAADKAREALLASLNKKFGEGAVFYGENMKPIDIESIPTGSIGVDNIIGIGGVPRGRIIEIYGPESSGKTTLALSIIAQAQVMGLQAAFIDMEHALHPGWAAKLGVDMSKVFFTQPDTGENAMSMAEEFAQSGVVDLIVVDSVAALVPRAEIEGEMGDSHVGLQARLMAQALRKITGTLQTTKTTMIFTNQLREKIGIMFGSPETTPGGRALKFYASLRLDIRRIQGIKRGAENIGNHVRVRVTKNKVAAPFRECEFDILYNEGISVLGELIDYGVDCGIVNKAGSYYKDAETGESLGQGRENAKQFLLENQDYAYQLHGKILEAMNLPALPYQPVYGTPTTLMGDDAGEVSLVGDNEE